MLSHSPHDGNAAAQRSALRTCGPSGRFEHIVFAGELVQATQFHASPIVRPTRGETSSGEPELDAASREFFSRLCAINGLDVSLYRTAVLRRRRNACLRAARASTVPEAMRAIGRGDSAADSRTLSALLIGVTSFFRDGVVFDDLKLELGRSAGGERLRVVSVGCSDGSELYSVAMILAELGRLDRSTLVGVDCRPAAIAAAAEGVYSASAAESVGAARRAAFLTSDAAGVRIAEPLRRACRWEVGDALTTDAIAQADVILCRNLAIYLNHAPATRLWTRLVAALRPGGLLVTGKAERPVDLAALVRVGPCLYRKRECMR